MRSVSLTLALLAATALPASAQGNPFAGIDSSAARAGSLGRPIEASPGLDNARIYHLGPLGSPGQWEIRGNGWARGELTYNTKFQATWNVWVAYLATKLKGTSKW